MVTWSTGPVILTRDDRRRRRRQRTGRNAIATRSAEPKATSIAVPRLHESAGALCHVRGFPPLGLLRPLRPTSGRRRTTRLPARHTWRARRIRSSEMVPTFTVIRCRVRRPALPRRFRHGYAAVLHRGLPTGKINPAQEFPTRNEGRVRTAIQPRSTGFELAEVLRCFKPLVPLVHLPVWLAGPAPSGSSGASRRCRGCSPPDPVVSPDPAAPSFNHFAATEQWCGSHTHTRTHSASWRTVSHLHSNNSASRRKPRP